MKRPYQLFRRTCGTFRRDPAELFCRPSEQFMRSHQLFGAGAEHFIGPGA